MDDAVCVALCGAPEHTGRLAKALGRFPSQARVLGVCAEARELEHLCAGRERVVALLCFMGEAEDETARVIKRAKECGVRVIAVCANVQSGFVLLKKGASEMSVLNDKAFEGADMSLNALLLKIKNVYAGYSEEVKRVMKDGAPGPAAASPKIVVIGSSTGGTETVKHIVCAFHGHMPPILIVQHMPPVFTRLYAERLNRESQLTVWEAQDGDELRPGLVLVAPGECQMRLTRRNGKLAVSCAEGERVNGHCPSVDVLFQSAAEAAGKNVIGVILTGMGSDGARGLLAIKERGGFTIGQDEASSVVYGMPRAAFELGAVDTQAGYEDIAKLIVGKI